MKVYNASGLEKIIPGGGGGADGYNIISAGTTKAATTGTVAFSNSNNVSFGMAGQTVTATVTVPAQSNQTLGLQAFTNTTAVSSSTTIDARTMCFIGMGGLSVGYSAGSIVLSGATGGGGADGVNILAAGTRTATTNGTILLSNANSISFGLNAVNGSVITASISTLPETPFAIRAGLSSFSSGTVSFANSNNISFGMNGASVVTASFSTAAQSAQTQSLIQAIYDGASSITTGTVQFSNSNGVSFGISGQTMTASVATSLTNVNVSAGTTSANLSNFVLSNSNSVSFGLSGSTITASISTLPETPFAIRAGVSSFSSGTVSFSNSNSISFGMNSASVITASFSVATSLTAINVSAGTTSANLSNVTFSNLNGVSFGLNASTITASIATSLTAINVSAGTTSGNLSNITFSNGSGVSFGLNASTLTASVSTMPFMSNFWNTPEGVITIAATKHANSSVSVLPFIVNNALAFSNLRVFVSVSLASAANNSSAQNSLSASVVLYTRNVSTLSSIWSGSYGTAVTWSSSNTSVFAGNRQLSISGLATTLMPGDYWAALHISSNTGANTGAATTSLGCSYSLNVLPGGASGALQADPWDGGGSNASRVAFPGLGIYSTNNTMPTIQLTDAALSQTSIASNANVVMNLRNWSIF